MSMEKLLNYYITEVCFKTSNDFVSFGLFLVEQNTS